MKKSLLNYKSLHFAILLLLLCANSTYSQTILTETFGTTANASYTGGTSVPLLSYTQSGGGVASTAIGTGTDAYLNLITNGVAPAVGTRATLSGTLPTVNGFSPILTDNTNLLTWTVNIKANQLGSNSSTSYALGKKFVCVVLCASNAGILGNVPPTLSDGYALMYQKNSADGTKASISLIKFHNGIGNSSTTADAQELCTASRLIESPALAVIPATATFAALSVKVVYNPNFDSWQLYYREDPAASTDPIVDPTTGDLLLAGTVTDATYTSTTMTNFGFISGALLNNNVKSQFDNFKIVLSTPPPYTAPPTVEKRQVFNSITTPTIADLIPTGAGIKWYATATGGTELATSTELTYADYYVSQTVSGTESDRVLSQVFVGDTALKTLPFHEDFANYNTNDKLIVINNDSLSGTGLGSWSVNNPSITAPFGANTDDALIAAQPSSWTSSVLPTPTGKAITFDKSGIDPQILFDAPTTGSVYASCLFMVTNLNAITSGSSGTSANTPPAPGHFFSLGYSAGAGQNTAYTAAVYLKTSSDPTKFNIGINASPADPISVDDIKWDTTDYEINTPITLVTSYSYDDKISKLWINPTDNSAEPTANATTLPRSAALAVDRLRLTQQSSATTPFITLDEIRVANNWGEALGASSTLGITPVKSTGIKIYPNPVSNGKLYIASATNLEKEVAIYNTLGQEVLQSKTNNQAINVSNLSKGTYFVKITEAGITVTKKLIIQ